MGADNEAYKEEMSLTKNKFLGESRKFNINLIIFYL